MNSLGVNGGQLGQFAQAPLAPLARRQGADPWIKQGQAFPDTGIGVRRPMKGLMKRVGILHQSYSPAAAVNT